MPQMRGGRFVSRGQEEDRKEEVFLFVT